MIWVQTGIVIFSLGFGCRQRNSSLSEFGEKSKSGIAVDEDGIPEYGGLDNAKKTPPTGASIYPLAFVASNLGLGKKWSSDPAFEVENGMGLHGTYHDRQITGMTEQGYWDYVGRRLIDKPVVQVPVLQNFKGPRKILSLGEGHSPLSEALRQEHSVKGLDLWYLDDFSSPPYSTTVEKYIVDRMRDYVERNKNHLYKGDATDLTRVVDVADGRMLRIPNEEYDFVLSHFLFNYLSPAGQGKMLLESLRVLKLRGEIRYASFAPADISGIIEVFRTLFKVKRIFEDQEPNLVVKFWLHYGLIRYRSIGETEWYFNDPGILIRVKKEPRG